MYSTYCATREVSNLGDHRPLPWHQRFLDRMERILEHIWGEITFFFKLFIYFWLCSVFVAVRGLSLVAASGGYSVAVRRLLIAVASLVAEHRL